jgi:hypothetical protein
MIRGRARRSRSGVCTPMLTGPIVVVRWLKSAAHGASGGLPRRTARTAAHPHATSDELRSESALAVRHGLAAGVRTTRSRALCNICYSVWQLQLLLLCCFVSN